MNLYLDDDTKAWRRTLFQQTDESGLLEMMITRQRLGDPPAFHHHEGDAIGEGPLLVRPLLLKLQPTPE